MAKIDLKKQYKDLYNTGKKSLNPFLIDVPSLSYLMIDGTGDPNNSERFQLATGALYATAYGIKFASKEDGRDFTVMGLEGLWWADDPTVFKLDTKEGWLWTLMILQPEWITAGVVDDALSAAVKKGKIDENLAGQVTFELLEEGKSAQILHLGPYADETPTIERLHGFVESEGYELRGKHHEIYMSDPRRVAPEKMKTILRHPVA